MLSPLSNNPHRENPDGSFDSICHLCWRTVGSSKREEDLAALEQQHVCRKSDAARMAGMKATAFD
jgi:hypothetical protein